MSQKYPRWFIYFFLFGGGSNPWCWQVLNHVSSPFVCPSQPSTWFAHRMDPALLLLLFILPTAATGLTPQTLGVHQAPSPRAARTWLEAHICPEPTRLASGTSLWWCLQPAEHTLGTSGGIWAALDIPGEHPAKEKAHCIHWTLADVNTGLHLLWRHKYKMYYYISQCLCWWSHITRWDLPQLKPVIQK